jgi:RNA polymerase sigma factor (sigma-70 family)
MVKMGNPTWLWMSIWYGFFYEQSIHGWVMLHHHHHYSWFRSSTTTSLQRIETTITATRTITTTTSSSTSTTRLGFSWSNNNDDNAAAAAAAAEISQKQWSTSDPENANNIIEDATGHVNRDLAERIWNWEQEHRIEKNLPKVNYSVRTGLRLVDGLVEEILQQNTRTDYNLHNNMHNRNENLRIDLIQEGLIKLLDVMSRYRDEHEEGFETYARKEIYEHLAKSLDAEERPIRLPKGVMHVVQEAKRLMMESISSENDGRRIGMTWADVAKKLNMPENRLMDYLRLARGTGTTISMESTVEILDPFIDDPRYSDQDEWELRQGMLLDDGHAVQKEQLVDEFLDDTDREGDDEAWIETERIAGPLQDLIPDTEEPTPDDLMLQQLIHDDLSNFVSSTLSPDKIEIVRLYFGLESGESLSADDTAKKLGKSSVEIQMLLEESLSELRQAYTKRYFGIEDWNNEFDGEDSV